ncbi:MAG TPA: phytanoyl-CoA dioxygenase family protein [Methylomirabilota bacterium]|jgi:ectoine hydroxylase-related dioxygenase (phytanoyl-CoA dioxygenase family)|nr:phytanoyl-CoA dioxygenase family protein [Methylomirabilota bacterium]
MATTLATRQLTDTEIAAYHRDGYLAVPRLIEPDRIEALRRVTDAFVERSRAVTRSDALFDLDARHTAAAPVLRRIKNPADNDALYRWVAFESAIVDIVAQLIGPSIRFHHSKLNLKGSLVGAAVEVHQDAAFYPHSNDDVLAVGLLLDDASEANGAMAVLPGSHRGPVHTHYDAQGRFVGCMRDDDVARLDRSRAVLLALPAGSVHIHHYRLVHWSAPNTSTAERRLLINSYTAADAFSFMPDTTGSPLVGTLLRGTPPMVARRTAGDMPLPPDFRHGYTSIYELQTEAKR